MKKADPRAVGGFVIGAVLLAVVAVVVFGSGRFFAERVTYVSFFDESLQGLRAGAPVEFRGMQIGSVIDGWVQYDAKTLEFSQPVVYEINVDHVREVGRSEAPENDLHLLLKKGLRAQLNPQSLVTGQQSVQLAMHPETPVNLVEHNLPYEQIPTVPSKFAAIESSMDKAAGRANDVLKQISVLLSAENQAQFRETLASVASLTAKLDQVATEFSQRTGLIDELAESADSTMQSYKALAERADGMIAKNEGKIAKVITGMQNTEKRIAVLTDEVRKAIQENRKGLNDFTTSGLYEITNLAVDSQAAMEQFRRVMEEMERDPARFFFGRPGEVKVK